jgi:LPXTG-site transpeptidase (sortase) family protein
VLLVLLAFAVACGSKGDKKTQASPTTERGLVFELPSVTPTVAGSETATATPEATPEGPQFPPPSENAQLTRLIIPSAKVNAPLQTKGVNTRNEMENPDGKDNVAWYNFTARPGFGSNAVFSGHVDWYTGERGVFWYLRDLKEGDEITLRLSDGMELKYRVVRNETFKADNAPVAEIVGPTTAESITLITCEGVFSRNSQDYSDRRVVRAERFG